MTAKEARELAKIDLIATVNKRLKEQGRPMRVIDENTVSAKVDGENELFHRDDVVAGQQMSGLRFFGSVHGDHRMIQHIADDVEYVFGLLDGLDG